jgi:hypothetical protein
MMNMLTIRGNIDQNGFEFQVLVGIPNPDARDLNVRSAMRSPHELQNRLALPQRDNLWNIGLPVKNHT